MKYLILLTLINFIILISGCEDNKETPSTCGFTYNVTHCVLDKTKDIYFIADCSCDLQIETYKRAMPVMMTSCYVGKSRRVLVINYCEYNLINKDTISLIH
jgi:hypothetical protein